MLRHNVPLCLSRKELALLGATHFLGQRGFSKGKQQKEVRQRGVACCHALRLKPGPGRGPGITLLNQK